jgi:KDO2-lipid IV(A) lauroyltransferase
VLRHRVEHAAFTAACLLCRALPRPALAPLGTVLGDLAWAADARHRRVAFENFRAAFPYSEDTDARRLVRRCFRFFGRHVLELAAAAPGLRAADMPRFEYEGLEHVEAAHRAGRGVLFFTGHFGGWELMAMAHGRLGYPLGVIARALDNPWLDRALRRLRQSTGNLAIDKRDGLRPMLQQLRAGGGIAILIDQNVSGGERVFVDFLGRPAATTPALALVHLKTGAPLVPVFALPQPGGRYRFVYEPPVTTPSAGDRREDVVRITQACTAVLERRIRERPELWLWMHRRWKTRPETDQDFGLARS